MALLTDRTLATGVTLQDLIHIVIPTDLSQNPAGSSYKATIEQVGDALSGSSFNTYVTGGTYSAGTATFTNNNGDTFDVSGFTQPFSGGSGNCITDLYVTKLHGCSPITVNDSLIITSGENLTSDSGNSELDLRADGIDSTFTLRSSSGYSESYYYGTQTYAEMGFGFGSSDYSQVYANGGGAGLQLVNSSMVPGSGVFISPFQIGTQNSDLSAGLSSIKVVDLDGGNAELTSIFPNVGVAINSSVIFLNGLDSSVALGVESGTGKTDNVAYMTNAGFIGNKDVYEGLLDRETLSADRAWELPDKSGKIALLSDIFTGNTSGTCITDLYITNLYGCSPITVHDNIQSVNSSATGTTSFAFGFDTKAHGDYSTASGYKTIASGPYSTSSGYYTTASGYGSHAEGGSTTSSSDYTHSEGLETIASGRFSHAEGSNTTASFNNAHAEGHRTTASGYASHAEGNQTQATGNTAHAEGLQTKAHGDYSHAQNYRTIASGNYSTASGYETTASGIYSTAIGYQSRATGDLGYAEGYLTLASGGWASHAEGGETTASGDYSHSEGNLTIASGNNSHAEGAQTTASGNNSHAEGSLTTATGTTSHAEGDRTTSIGVGSHAEGSETISQGNYSHAEGWGFKFSVIASGVASHAEGFQTTASGNYSHAEGETTIASGVSSHAEGQNTTAIGNNSHAEGKFTTASGDYSHSEGNVTIAIGSESHAEGAATTALGDESHAEGGSTIASGKSSHAEGVLTTASGYASHTEGYDTIAIGDYSHAEGYGRVSRVTAFGQSSHAEGDSTTAQGIYSHAEGQLSVASGGVSHAEGTGTLAIGNSSHSQNVLTTASGYASHASGNNSVASGNTSFIHSTNSLVTGDRSAVLGGQNLTGTTDDTVYVPNFVTNGKVQKLGITTLSLGATFIPTTNSTVRIQNNGSAVIATLPDGTPGQRLTIYVLSAPSPASGSTDIQPITSAGFTSALIATAGESVDLIYDDTIGWVIIGNNGATIS